jgi:purine-binding chemotaxis protein CheW
VEPQGKAQYLTFFLGDEEYAVPLERVREIVEHQPTTRVPSVPACIRGVINLRGAVVPVIDLRLKFAGGESPITRLTCQLVVEVEIDSVPTAMALLVDRASQLLELGAGEIEPPPPFGTQVRVDFLRGLARREPQFVLLLDVDRVLCQHELLAAAELSQEA